MRPCFAIYLLVALITVRNTCNGFTFTLVRHTGFGRMASTQGGNGAVTKHRKSSKLSSSTHQTGVQTIRISDNVSSFFQVHPLPACPVKGGTPSANEGEDDKAASNLIEQAKMNGKFMMDSDNMPTWQLPNGKTEAWRHLSVQTLFPTKTYTTPSPPKDTDEEAQQRIRAAVDEYVHEECEESCLVFVNGRYMTSLSRTTKLKKIRGQMYVGIHSADQQNAYNHNYSEDIENNENSESSESSSKSVNSVRLDQAALEMGLAHVPDASETQPRDSFSSQSLTAVNLANAADVCVLQVPINTHISTPMQIINYSYGDSAGAECTVSFPRLQIEIADGSTLKLKQTFIGGGRGDCMVVSSTHARVAPGSSFAHTYEQHLPHGEQLEEEGEGEGKGGPNSGPAEEEGEGKGKGMKTNGKGRCLEILSAELMGEESVYIGSILQAGATIGRINAHLHATHSSSNISLSSVTLAHTDQSLDLHSSIVHLAAGQNSRQQHRNVVGNKGTAIFKGRIRIPKVAQQTDSEQLCRSLMLGERARIIAMPTLEITADDVTCSHGASVADLDENSLFYLSARGVNRQEARKLLMRGFSLDVISGPSSLVDKRTAARVIKKTDMMAKSGDDSLYNRIDTRGQGGSRMLSM